MAYFCSSGVQIILSASERGSSVQVAPPGHATCLARGSIKIYLLIKCKTVHDTLLLLAEDLGLPASLPSKTRKHELSQPSS